MAHYVAPLAAVDIIDKQLVVLQLASAQGRLWVHQWHQQPATQACSQKLHCRALMTVMDHRAVHYQQLSEHQQLHQVRESVHASLGLEHTQLDTLTLDYQHTPLGTQVVSGHCSQVRKKQQQFEVLKCPVSIVEPAFQAVIRATNFLLAEHYSPAQSHAPSPEWQILQLAEPLSTLIRCHYGSISALSFHSESDLTSIIGSPLPTFYFGNRNISNRHQFGSQPMLQTLALPSYLQENMSTALGDQLLPLFGCALRGFIKWHH